MPIPPATHAYTTDCPPVVARGVAYTIPQLDEILAGSVQDILQDTVGTAKLHGLLSSVATTEFEQQGLAALLKNKPTPDNWRVGEAIAEAYVVEQENCTFPWPTSRDLKNSDASPAGADLTGFQKLEHADLPYRFAFGEVKTSAEEKWPPQLMYGRTTGLKKQLEDLRDSESVKRDLVVYLGHHATHASWKFMYVSASQRYLRSNSTDIAIFGVLIRDVEAKEADLSARARALAKNCPTATSIALYALYFPANTIPTLSDRAVAAMHSGDAT